MNILVVDVYKRQIKGAVAIMKHLGLKKGHIGVEENKPDAIEKLRKVIADMGHSGDIEVNVLRARYPVSYTHLVLFPASFSGC